MAEPRFDNLLDEEVETSAAESCNLVIKASDARVSAAYWQGRFEGQEVAMAWIGSAHEATIRQMAEGHELIVAYLKDRLNRLEVSHGSRADS